MQQLQKREEQQEKKEEMLDEEIEAMIEERQQARKNKNFKKADEIREAVNEICGKYPLYN